MKKIKLISMLLLLGVLVCCKDDKEQMTIVQDIIVTNNGDPYTASARLLFIYDRDGRRVANYNPFERFIFDNGAYYMFCANPVDAIPSGWEEIIKTDTGEEEPEVDIRRGPYALHELIWHQTVEAVDSLSISDVRLYTLPHAGNLRFDMVTRTGKIRFISLDSNPEPEITFDRADFSLTVHRTGYKISDSSYIDGTMEITRSVETNNGIGIREEFTVLPTHEEGNGISLTIRCYREDLLVMTLSWEGTIEVAAGQTTVLQTYFEEPEPNEPDPNETDPNETDPNNLLNDPTH